MLTPHKPPGICSLDHERKDEGAFPCRTSIEAAPGNYLPERPGFLIIILTYSALLLCSRTSISRFACASSRGTKAPEYSSPPNASPPKKEATTTLTEKVELPKTNRSS